MNNPSTVSNKEKSNSISLFKLPNPIKPQQRRCILFCFNAAQMSSSRPKSTSCVLLILCYGCSLQQPPIKALRNPISQFSDGAGLCQHQITFKDPRGCPSVLSVCDRLSPEGQSRQKAERQKRGMAKREIERERENNDRLTKIIDGGMGMRRKGFG